MSEDFYNFLNEFFRPLVAGNNHASVHCFFTNAHDISLGYCDTMFLLYIKIRFLLFCYSDEQSCVDPQPVCLVGMRKKYLK